MMDNQTLLSNEVSEAESNGSVSKIVVFGCLGIIFSFFFGYFLKLFTLDVSRWDFFTFSFIAGLGFLSFFLLNVFFIKSAWISRLIAGLEISTLLVVFYSQLSVILLAAAAISFLILFLADYDGRQELGNMLKIKFWRVSKKIVPKAIFALAIFVSVVYFAVAGMGGKEFFISQSTFEKIFLPSFSWLAKTSPVQNLLPGFDPSLTIKELLQNMAEKQIEQTMGVNSLPPEAKTQLLNQTVGDLEKTISGFVGQPIDPEAKVSDVIYQVMVNKIGTLSSNVKDAVPILAALLLFLTILSLGWPIRLMATILAFVIYEICLALGFGVIMTEGRDREIVVLK